MSQQTILQIAVPTPLRKSFDYLLTDPNADLFEDISFEDKQARVQLKPGIRVLVPFGGQQLTGILLAIKEESNVDTSKLKPIIALLDDTPLLSASMINLMHWTADYYQHPMGECFATALPNLLRKGEALINEPNDRVIGQNKKQHCTWVSLLNARGYSDFVEQPIAKANKCIWRKMEITYQPVEFGGYLHDPKNPKQVLPW